MKRIALCVLLLTVSAFAGYTSVFYLTGLYSAICMFFSGTLFGMFLMILKLNSKNDKINSYKRELERESISSDEAGAKVKVLESKIQVLEKALENALNK